MTALSLLERIAAQKASVKTLAPILLEDDSDCFSLTTVEPIPEISYHDLSKYPEPSFDLFVACWTPFLIRPYNVSLQAFREYKRWLLSPSLYVLGTFPRIDSQHLFELLMREQTPSCISECYLLAQLCWEIDLTVPAKYQAKFEEIIRRKKS
jgi:hypothetical protein